MSGSIAFQGLGSGIDGASVARAAAENISIKNEVYKASIESQNKESDTLSQFKSLLLDLEKTLDGLRTVNGGASQFGVSASNPSVLTAVAGKEAAAKTFTVDVKSLAQTGTASFSRVFSSLDETILNDLGDSGSVTLSVGEGSSQQSFQVAIGPETTVREFISNLNSAAGDSVFAYSVPLSEDGIDGFAIALSSVDTGKEKGSLNLTFGNPELAGSNALGEILVEQARDAELSISGVGTSLTRGSNSIDDAIPGVKLSLLNEGKTNITVSASAGASRTTVEKVLSQFNAVQALFAREDAVKVANESGQSIVDKGSLAETGIDDQVFSALKGAFSSATSSDGSLSLSGIGISTNRDGSFAFDVKAFEAAFLKSPSKVNELVQNLADSVAGAEGVIQPYTGYGRGIDQAIEANREEVERVNQTIEQVERSAGQKEAQVLKAFTSLESIIAKLNADSSFISGLLKF